LSVVLIIVSDIECCVNYRESYWVLC